MIKESKSVSDIKLHSNPDLFKDKSCIYIEYIFIKPEYRNKMYARDLISYVENLGYDYMWEMSVEKVAAKYWLKTINRNILFEYDDTDEPFGRTYVTYKRLNNKVFESTPWKKPEIFINIRDNDKYHKFNPDMIFKNTITSKSDDVFSKRELNKLRNLNKFKLMLPSTVNYYKYGTNYIKLYSNSFGVDDVYLEIIKSDDDWFMIKILVNDSFYIFRTSYWKCDQIDGLIEFLNKFQFTTLTFEKDYN